MGPRDADLDPDLDEGLDPEGPSAADLDRFGDEFIACPNCGRAIYDQAQICPKCGDAVVGKQVPIRLWVIVVAALLVLGLVILSL